MIRYTYRRNTGEETLLINCGKSQNKDGLPEMVYFCRGCTWRQKLAEFFISTASRGWPGHSRYPTIDLSLFKCLECLLEPFYSSLLIANSRIIEFLVIYTDSVKLEIIYCFWILITARFVSAVALDSSSSSREVKEQVAPSWQHRRHGSLEFDEEGPSHLCFRVRH